MNANADGRFSFRFGLKSLLLTVMLFAAWLAGWVSHREWNKRSVEEAIVRGVQRIGSPVQFELDSAANIITLSGQNEQEVSELKQAVSEISSAARK